MNTDMAGIQAAINQPGGTGWYFLDFAAVGKEVLNFCVVLFTNVLLSRSFSKHFRDTRLLFLSCLSDDWLLLSRSDGDKRIQP